MQKVVETIKIEKLENGGFNVVQGDRYSERLGYDEMLGLVSALTMPEKRNCLSWMKTKKEHEASRGQLSGSPSEVEFEDILVPEEIGICKAHTFSEAYGDDLIIRFGDEQCLGVYNKSYIVFSYTEISNYAIPVKCKLIPCKREDLKPGDTAFSNLLDDKYNLYSYCKVIGEGQVAHMYYRDKPCVRVSIWSDEPSLQWYKVVPV